MTLNTPNPASAAARTGSGKHHKRLASDFSDNRLSARDIQAIFLTRHFRVPIALALTASLVGEAFV